MSLCHTLIVQTAYENVIKLKRWNKSDTVVRVNLLYPTMKCSNTSFLQKTQHFSLIFQVDWLQTDRVQQIGN